ncbi:MAG: OmpA family protein, partial [Acidobacteriota bacterium]|nr:OmpA family protein [Acidobacteriota bacterium]
MKKALLCLVAGVFLLAISAQAQVENLPPNPVPGKCYVRCITKDTFKTVVETIEIAPAYKTLKVVPATYRTVEERVMIKEASKRLIYIPAVYETVEVSYVVKEAGTDFTIIPAAFGTTTKSMEISPATSGWKYTLLADCPSVNKADCIVVCFVELPARMAEFEITTLVSDASSSRVALAEAKSVYKKQVVVTPARMDEIEIAAEYAMIEKQIIDQPGRVEEVVIPAKYKEVTKSVLDKKGGMAVWEEVDCNLVGTYTLLPILYDYDSAVITPESKQIIDENLL